MTTLHELSDETALSEFDIFGVPATQTTVDQDICSEHRPSSTLSSKAFIEFNVNTGIDEYVRLADTMIYMRLRVHIDKPMKSKVANEDWKNVSTVNNLLHSLFKQVDFTIGDRQVTLSYQTYSYKCDIETKLGKSKEAKESFLTGGLWYEDDPEKPESINQIRSSFIEPDALNEDKSIGRELDLLGKIHLDMFEQDRPLIGGCSLKLKFTPNDPSFYMMCTSDVCVTGVEFTDAVLFVHRSKISRRVLEGHLKALAISNAKYPIRRSFVVPSTINKGTMDAIIDNVYNGQLPRRAFVAMVSHNAFNGSFILNPYNYQHFNLSYLSFYLNGVPYPEKPFTPDFLNGNYIREYMSIFDATNQLVTDSCISLDRRNYPKGSTIIGVNFSPDLSSSCCSSGYTSPIKFGSMRIQVRFREPLKETINLLVYLEFDSIIEINQEKNPIFEFN